MHLRNRNALIAFAVALLAYGVILFTHLCDVAGGSDSSGYLNEARMIAGGRLNERIEILDEFALDDSLAPLFVPLGYDVTPVRSRVMVPTYPAGLPMHMALAGKRGAFFVVPIAALIAIALMAWLAHQITDSWWIAVAAAGALGCCAVFIFHALQPVTDVLVTMWSIAAISAALRSRKDERWSFVAGAAFAIGVWIRPANVLLGPALLVALPKYKRAFVGAAIFLAPLLLWNAKLYGGPLRTGYGSIAQYLELAHFPARAWHYIKWTIALLSPFTILGMLHTRIRPSRGVVVAVLPLLLLLHFVRLVELHAISSAGISGADHRDAACRTPVLAAPRACDRRVFDGGVRHLFHEQAQRASLQRSGRELSGCRPLERRRDPARLPRHRHAAQRRAQVLPARVVAALGVARRRPREENREPRAARSLVRGALSVRSR